MHRYVAAGGTGIFRTVDPTVASVCVRKGGASNNQERGHHGDCQHAPQHVPTAFTANDLTKLNWEIIIEDQKDATIHTSLNNTIAISNVKLFGIDATDGIKSTKSSSSSALKATYGSSLVLTYSVPGTTANIAVVRLDGSKVASFQAAAKATNLSLPD